MPPSKLINFGLLFLVYAKMTYKVLAN